MTLLSIILSVILGILALLHFSWALGSQYGFAHSLPTNEKGERVLNPSKLDSALIGGGLALFSLFYLVKSGVIWLYMTPIVMEFGGWVILTIFTFRAMGDFKYIGFFKRVKGTPFSKLDTSFYSPLCLLMTIIGLTIEITQLLK